MKIIVIIWLGLVWEKILIAVVGTDAALAVFMVQAIYCRIRYFRDSQFIFDDEKNAMPIEAEVI